jgi:type II secretion system protein N
MPRIFKIIIYTIVFFIFFFLFLYWMFPYDILKDRVAAAIEEPLGRAVEVSIGEIEPYYFTGISISKLSLSSPANGGSRPIIELQKVRGRISLFSLLFGNPRITFMIRSGKGRIEGSGRQTDVGFDLELELDDFDVSTVKWLSSAAGLNLTGFLSGDIDISVDRARPTRSKGKIDLKFKNFKLNPSNLMVADTAIPIPEIIFSKAQGSILKLDIDKGSATVEEFKFTEGDLQLDLKGKVFLSTVVSNYRLNLSGSFAVSEKLAKEVPYLVMADSQKQQDGSYPLAVTGRISSPSVKIGTFTLPF